MTARPSTAGTEPGGAGTSGAGIASNGSVVARAAASPVLLWCAFVLAHLMLGLLNLVGPGWPLGDVTSVYKFWSDQAVIADYWVGIDGPWVYPVVAIVPMLLAHAVYPIGALFPGSGVVLADAGPYASSWLTMVLAFDLIAFGVLTGWGRRRERFPAGWWWIGFLLLLGPIAMGRIDSVTVPVALVGALFIATRPQVAAIVLTIAAWIKVWPGALVVAMVVTFRGRWRVLGTAAAVSAGVAAIALALGGGLNVLSFVTQQASRGLQIEAPIATPWMWRAAAVSDTEVYYDQDLLTWQVRGPGAEPASELMTPLLLFAVAGLVVLGLIAQSRGVAPTTLLPPLCLAIVTSMIAFQKVGSPQFISWLAVPVILGLTTRRAGVGASFGLPAVIALALAALTQVIYPYRYGDLIGLEPWMLVVVSVRNILVFVLLAVAIRSIAVSIRRRSREGGPDDRRMPVGVDIRLLDAGRS